MPKELLSVQKIKKLDKLLHKVFDFIKDLKKQYLLADKIKNPQLPSSLTESLTIHLLKKKKFLKELKGYDFGFGGRTADILATKGSKQITIEVKATGEKAFQYFGDKDISADYIVWVHFADFFMGSGHNSIKLFIVKKPGIYFKRPVKITLQKLKQKVGGNLEEIDFDIESL
jgi:hypothetical protein